MIEKGDYVKVVKVAAVENPVSPTPTKDQYEYGYINQNISLPIEYELVGTLFSDITEGESMCVIRDKRNDVQAPGLFQSTLVQKVEREEDKIVVYTRNSQYIVTPETIEED